MTIVDLHAHPLLDRFYAAPRPDRPNPCGSRLSLDALASGGVGVVVSSIYPFWCPARGSAYMTRCRDILDRVETHLAEHHDRATGVTDPGQIAPARARGQIAFVHAVEGGHVLEGRLANLETLYRWGVRSLTLTHFVNNDLAASSFDPRRKLSGRDGLTPFGRDVVAGMNDLGMVIDLAHCSEPAFWQAMELTEQPVIVSHTGVRNFVRRESCLSDEQIRALARNNGVVGIILSSIWLKRFQPAAGIDDLVDNILYVRDLVGADHVGIGSDFNGTPPIRGVATAGDLPRISARLSAAGLPDRDVAKIMGGNVLRVFADVVRPG
jgi:membrane dipeptidase